MPDRDPPGPPAPSFREEEPDSLPAAHFRPDPVVNPPPRFLAMAYRVPADRLFEAALDALKASGVVVASIEREILLVTGTEAAGPGLETKITASVQETARGGSRVLLTCDRPPGTPFDPRIDEKRLQQLLGAVDQALARVMGG
jgi:hypothetical protein